MLQSERSERYAEAVDALLASGHGYECYCTEDEVRARNDAARRAGRPPGYDGHCRDLPDEARSAYEAEGRSSVVRFRTPDEGVSRFHDVIRGDVTVEWALIHDFVILRSDDTPIFFLANAVDDMDMGITHVIRGEDLLDSTHRVLALRDALGGGPQPVYAHLPLILAADRAKLSKRHGADAVEEFRDQGYLQEALVNYLALQGWSPADDREVLSVGEIVAEFSLDRVTHAAAVFDHKKLDWINGQWMRRLPLEELTRRVEPDARARSGERFDPDVFAQAVAIGQERATTTRQLVEQMDFLFVDGALVVGDDAWAKVESTERVREVFTVVIAHVETCEWTVGAIDMRDAIRGSRNQVTEGDARALRGHRRSRPGPAPLRLDLAPRPRARARAPPCRTGSARVSSMVRPFGATLRGWCNRQHNRFWPCHWGFESSPPSQARQVSARSGPVV